MRKVTIFGKKPIPLFFSLLLLAGCATSYYYIYQANAQLKPVLPPLAAQRHLEQWLELLASELTDREPLSHLDLVREIYRRSDYRLLWLDSYELSDAGTALIEQLNAARADELINYHYHFAYLRQRLHNLPARPKDATAIDILLTDAFVTYAEDVLNSSLLPNALAHRQPPGLHAVGLNTSASINASNPHNQHAMIVSLIAESKNTYALKHMLQDFEPQHTAYRALLQALQQYQQIAASNDWRPLQTNETLTVGMRDPVINRLRNLLAIYGDYPLPKQAGFFDWLSKKSSTPTAVDPQLFDDELQASVQHFQSRHGLPTTGKVDKQTREQLNVAPTYRIKQIAYNLKRWRQLPADLGERYIWVNMTDYRLDVREKDRSILSMKVIVGKTSRRTPVMYENINSVVLNPQWNVPRRIMVRDILPKAKEDPNYLAQRNIRIINGWQEALEVPLDQIDLNAIPLSRFPYRLQQDPGEDNALGVVKFVIPNDDSIYLHDTNSPELFGEHYRALSSGCVRVEKPLVLAELLLKGKRGWDRKKIDAVIAQGDTTYVKLPEAIPTYLWYWTAWVDEHGQVQFRDDIYQEDKVLQQEQRDLEALML